VNDAERLRHDPAIRGLSAGQRRRPPRGIVLDLDSSVSPTHGEQEMSVWNGHYACACYHPLFVFNQFGDLERCALRPGNVHSADGWDAVLKPVVARYQGSHQHDETGGAGRRLLQQARHLRAMDQGRQGGDQVDAIVMPDVRSQRRPSPASFAGLQPCARWRRPNRLRTGR
jgi:hypothetical protein